MTDTGLAFMEANPTSFSWSDEVDDDIPYAPQETRVAHETSEASAAKAEVEDSTQSSAPSSSPSQQPSQPSTLASTTKDTTTDDVPFYAVAVEDPLPRSDEPEATTYLHYRTNGDAVKDDADEDSSSFPSYRRRSSSVRDPGRLERPWRRSDRGSMNGSVDEDNKPGRFAKKYRRVGEKPKEEEPKVPLAEAPIPVVNPWLKAKEAAAKAAPVPTTPAPVPTESAWAKTAQAGKTSLAETIATEAEAKRASDSQSAPRWGNGAPTRNGPRGSRGDQDAALASIADEVSWPTPETSLQEKKKTTEKDGAEETGPSKPRNKEKWVAYDYVPSVSFETQIPQRTNKGRNNSTPNGTTDSQSGDKMTNGKYADDASSMSSSYKRASVDGSQWRDQRKTSGSAPGDKKDPATQTVSIPVPNIGNPKRKSKAKPKANINGNPSGRPTGNPTGDAEASAHSQANHAQPQNWRERTDSNRSGDRTRGGFRPRGGHAGNLQTQMPHLANGFSVQTGMPNRPQGPYSPPPRQNSYGQIFGPPSQRGGRGGRNGYHRMSLPNGIPRMPMMNPYGAAYDYSMMPMSAMTYQPQPYWDQVVMNMLRTQIEYYFSIENLCKDMYLRARMDSQGFVPLHFVAAFKRVRSMSTDLAMIRAVCETSNEIDLVVGEDELERVRRHDGWDKWVLAMEERDEFARTEGPTQLTFKNRSAAAVNGMQQQYQYFGYVAGYGMNYDGSMQQHQQQPQQHYGEQQQHTQAPAPAENGDDAKQSLPLSASVPDFSPATASPALNGSGRTSPKTNGVHVEAPEDANGVHEEASEEQPAEAVKEAEKAPEEPSKETPVEAVAEAPAVEIPVTKTVPAVANATPAAEAPVEAAVEAAAETPAADAETAES